MTASSLRPPMSPAAQHAQPGPARRRAPVATVIALVLAALALQSTPLAAAAQPAPPGARSARDVPLLTSDPAPKVVPEVLVGDFTNPPPNPDQLDAGPRARPSAYDPARSTTIDAETTATKKVVANTDGSRTEITAASPVRFRDAGGWHDIDLSLVPGPGATLVARSAQTTARLGSSADGIVASIDTPAGPIGLRHPQAAPAAATTDKARATYPAALGPGRDLILDLRVNGFEETVMVPSAQSPNTYLDEFVLPAGVSARDGEAGVEFADAKGTVLATFSNGIAFDSAPQRAAAPVTVRVVPTAAVTPATTVPAPAVPSTTVPSTSTPSTTVVSSSSVPTTTPATTPPSTPAENVATVEVSVDRAWLADPARVLPVAMDPTYTTVATNASDAYGIDTFGWAAAPTTNYGTATALYVGYVSGVSQSFIKFNNLVVAPSPDSVVIESHLMLLGGAANDCAKPVSVHGIDATLSAATVWNNRPATSGALVSSTALAANCASIWNTFDTTSLARSWITAGAPNNGLRVSATDEADPAGFKWFWSGNTANPPLLYITYDRPPGLSNPVAPANGGEDHVRPRTVDH